MQSRLGRPDMDEVLDADMQGTPPHAPLCSDEEVGDNRGESDSDESEWGTVRGNFRINDILRDRDGGGDAEEEGEIQLYVPEPVVTLCSSSNQKPDVPRLPIESFPFGRRVWVVDEEDVHLLLREYWDDSYRAVCNGRLSGTVVRHSYNLTLVLFHDSHLDVTFSLSLPRACLSTAPIEAYSRSPHVSSGLLNSYFGIGNLGPRTGRGREESTATALIKRQFYEALPVMEVQVQQGLPRLSLAQDLLLEGAFEEALALLNELLAGASERADVLVLRSRANIFLEKYEEALRDALDVIALNPHWVRGYLSAARAQSGLGKFSTAASQINRVMLMLPHSRELRKIEELNAFLQNLQRELPSKDLSLYLDFRYAKQLLACRRFRKADVVYSEDRAVLAMESIFSDSPSRCCVCLKPRGEMMRVPVESGGCGASEELACYCSVECQQRSSLFFAMELGRHRAAVRDARDLISVTSTMRMRHAPLDMACMAVRLYLMICVTHERLSSQQRRHADSSTSLAGGSQSAGSNAGGLLPLQAALKHLGVFPLPTDTLGARVRDEMCVVYDTLTRTFTEDEKQMYPLAFFYALYEYVRTFAVSVVVEGEKPDCRLYYLPKLLGAVRRVEPAKANCVVSIDHATMRMSLVAVRDILSDETLSIPMWDAANTR
ncbi:hypothetical protein DQ04_00021250 [Trypanosoma grayi]|uniref:hypothetical protein n=1 Tax=Trypanosoma grayi TaxID=71804 RepID=UPI0004F41289|nr:hypothetical protein DQ04_00021250 [Trypanosoma grayi]KEG15627.1 hypothetical protein DQ04_00021250 [Trypanosoma grayi]